MNATIPKSRFPAAAARAAADELCRGLVQACEPGYLTIAGSLRRQKPEVGDVEILFVPRCGMAQTAGEMFERPVNLAERVLEDLIVLKAIAPRLNQNGSRIWGDLIKLAHHLPSGIPVDFFSATKENWWNYLVCRTGPRESNEAIATAARRRGWKWKPYSPGFCRADDPEERCVEPMHSERQVFEFVGLPYLEPAER